jgi:hypothetical protein
LPRPPTPLPGSKHRPQSGRCGFGASWPGDPVESGHLHLRDSLREPPAESCRRVIEE